MNNFINPAPGTRLTSKFGYRTIFNNREMHYGIDLAEKGNVSILAAANGKVRAIWDEDASTYGNVIFVTHTINGKTHETVYAHLKRIYVKVGQTVKQGDIIALMGNTGRSNGQHLHFEIHNGPYVKGRKNAVDPWPLISTKKADDTLYRVLGSLVDKDATEKAAERIRSKVGWLVHVVKNGDKYQIKTGTFKGKGAGENAAEIIRDLGFKATLVKA